MSKAVDVSAWQETIDWDKAKADGVTDAILRITSGSSDLGAKDKYFEANYKGCIAAGINVGVYRYSYAKSLSDIKAEAEGVVAALAGRSLKHPVFLDLEWDWQRKNVSRSDLGRWAEAFRTVIEKAGYTFGIYANKNWVDNVLPSSVREYPLWVARYPSSDDGSVKESLRVGRSDYPMCWGWQYSSKGSVKGISGKVDMNVIYGEVSGLEAYSDFTAYKGMISNSGSDENGKYHGGAAGDQTGKEWRLRSWYSRPWTYVIRFTDTGIANMIATLAIRAARNDNIGYDQYQRGTYWTQLEVCGYDPAAISTKCESDCSAGVLANVKAALILTGHPSWADKVSPSGYTGNMKNMIRNCGADVRVLSEKKYLSSADYLLPGDILLNEACHTATCVGMGSLVGASTRSQRVKALKKALNEVYRLNLTGSGHLGMWAQNALRLHPLRYDEKHLAVNEHVRWVQETLVQLGYTVTVDRSYGPATEAAVKKFQKANGLKVDGIAGLRTHKKMIQLL